MHRLLLLLFLPLLFSGCSPSDKPQAIWQEPSIHPLVYPRGIAYSATTGDFFVVDRLARIQRISHDGHYLGSWQMPESANGKPVGISVGPDGNIYIPDTHYHRVIVYTPDGREIRRWGGMGTAPGQFIYPTDIAFDSTGRIFVSEYGDNDRIQVFDPQGQFLYQFGQFGQKEGQFSRPQSMVIDGPLLYLTDSCNHRIDVFTLEGKFVRQMGSAGNQPGEFLFPYGLDQDNQGHLLVTEFGNNRIQIIDKQTGKSIRQFGHAGRAEGELAYPWAAVFAPAQRVVIVDSGNNRLQIVGF